LVSRGLTIDPHLEQLVDGHQPVSVAELVLAVSAALNGC